MAKNSNDRKNRIERTILEGGRSESSKMHRRCDNRALRHRTQRVLRELLVTGTADEALFPVRDPVFIEHTDKVRAPRAWLLHHALGKTHAEIIGFVCARFDRRNLAQRHLLIDHLLPEIQNRYDGSFAEVIRFRRQVYRFVDGRLCGPDAD